MKRDKLDKILKEWGGRNLEEERKKPGFKITSKASEIEHEVDNKCSHGGGSLYCRCLGLKAAIVSLKKNIGACDKEPDPQKCREAVNNYIKNNSNLIKEHCVGVQKESKEFKKLDFYLFSLQESELLDEFDKNAYFREQDYMAVYKKVLAETGDKKKAKEAALNHYRAFCKKYKCRDRYCTEQRQKTIAKIQALEESKILDEAGFTSKPKGWSDSSVKKAGRTLAKHVGKKSPADKGFFDKCVAKMRGKIKNPEGYCAAMKDEATGSTFWRGKDKSKKVAKQQIRRHQNV